MKKYLKNFYDAGTIAFQYTILYPLYSVIPIKKVSLPQQQDQKLPDIQGNQLQQFETALEAPKQVLGPQDFYSPNQPLDEHYPYTRGATAGKAPKAWALPRFWVSIRSYKKQLVKKNGVEYWALPGSNLPWRPYTLH